MQYLHPKDGVYPEKVNKGRQGANVQDRRIGENTNPVKVRCRALLCACSQPVLVYTQVQCQTWL